MTAAFAPGLCRVSRRFGGLVVAAIPFALGCWFASVAGGVWEGTPVTQSVRWLPELGIDLAFRVDGLGLMFALLICLIGSGVLLYASSYLAASPRLGAFLGVLTAFMAAMLGLVLADNLILLFVFWELTSITSFLLIGFEHEREGARRASVQALLTTGLGGLALLAGVVLLGLSSGTWTISELDGERVLASGLHTPIAVLVLLGAFTKSAIFPFHYWLPNAMEAPSPVSALLHSATMVKAGVYLVARLNHTMAGPLIWDESLALLGGVTMVLGAFLATRQDQLKKILAYSTVSSLGTLVMLLGLGAAKAAATYLLAHAIFKGCLFLVAGSVTKATGEKDPERLGGLVTRAPVLGGSALVAALSMAGMFPLIGFVGKELVLKAGLSHPEWAALATIGVAVSGALTVMAALIVGARPFVLSPGAGVRVVWSKAPGVRQLAAPVALAAAGLVAGLAPALFAEPLVGGMVASIDPGAGGEVRLRWLELLWPPSTATVLSLGALGAGSLLFVARRRYRAATAPLARLDRFGPARGYGGAISGLTALAKWHTRFMQNGSLQVYVRVMLLFVTGVVGLALSRSLDWSAFPGVLDAFSAFELMLVIALAGATIAAIMQKTALATIACLSGVGFVLAILFALFGAPDLAMTQFSVETLLLIIFVLVLFHLPRYRDLSSRASRLWDIGLAGVFGVVVSLFVIAVLDGEAPESVAAFHAENSVPGGFGRNVVNVILVDFRALDTLGEIFVIGVAGVGVYTMLCLRSRGGEESAS
ncbi:MAG: proton-conducting transporter membrane subunit [Phycisphaerales bacterium]